MGRSVFTVFVLVFLLSQPVLAAGDGLDGALQCPCDCGKFLVTCDCESAAEAEAFVDSLRRSGRDESEIAERYGERYGEEFVNYVPKSGRGLSLWLLPPIGVVIGAGALYYRLRRPERHVTGSGRCEGCGAELGPDACYCTECGAEAGVSTCGACGATVQRSAAFCTKCGEPIVAGCSSCGAAAEPGARFCSNCGEAL